jgi:hypothetical protein
MDRGQEKKRPAVGVRPANRSSGGWEVGESAARGEGSPDQGERINNQNTRKTIARATTWPMTAPSTSTPPMTTSLG